jgi:hypothetical protein
MKNKPPKPEDISRNSNSKDFLPLVNTRFINVFTKARFGPL